MNFAIGEVIGPLIGNELYIRQGMPKTSDSVGMFILMFTLLYFIA